MAAFEYEREEYQAHLKRIERNGTYQEYENEIFEMNQLKNDLVKNMENIPHVDNISCLIDQVENCYYGDIGFHTDKLLDEFDVFFVAGAICAAIREEGEECQQYSLYYNRAVQSFMFTKVCICANDGPNLYAQGTQRFVIR